jgi:cobyrinic acid a,c-diamide synthase
MNLSTGRLLVSGTDAGVGKSLTCFGIVLALRKHKVGVATAILGPRLGLASFYQRITGRLCPVVDATLLTNSQIIAAIQQVSIGADIVIIDGNGDFFEPNNTLIKLSSDYEFAKLTSTPVLMVGNVSYDNGIAKLIEYLERSRNEISVIGSILNKIPIENNGQLITDIDKVCVQRGIPSIAGILPKLSENINLQDNSFSSSATAISLPRSLIVEITELTDKNIDLDRILESSKKAMQFRPDTLAWSQARGICKIAVTNDLCFSLCVQDNIDLLRYFGAEIKTCSPLTDNCIPPDVTGIYITGGLLDYYIDEVINNTLFIESLRKFHSSGGIIYSEGSGSAYLSQSFLLSGKKKVYDGVGILPGFAEGKKNGKMSGEYLKIDLTSDSLFGLPPMDIKALSLNHFSFMPNPGLKEVFRVTRIYGKDNEKQQSSMVEGYTPDTSTLCTFNYLNFGSNRNIAKRLVESVEVCKLR